MNLHFKKKKNFTKKLMAQAQLSLNSYLIVFSNFENEIFVFSTLQFKQLRKFRLNSLAYSFSPSSQQLAVSTSKSELQVITIGSHQLVYKQLLSNKAKIQYIKFKNENILIASSYITSEIFQVDINNNKITMIIKMDINNSSLAYGQSNDVLVFVERKTQYLQVWSVSESLKLFQSEPFTNDPLAIQLIDSKDLVLVKMFYSQILHQIDYKNKEIRPYQFQIPKSIYGYAGSRIHDDQIVTIAPYNKNNPQVIVILFQQIDSLNTITKAIQISLDDKRIQSFRSQNRLFLTIIAKDPQKFNNSQFQLIRICQK